VCIRKFGNFEKAVGRLVTVVTIEFVKLNCEPIPDKYRDRILVDVADELIFDRAMLRECVFSRS
jgi:hypothetical protein